MNTSLLPSIPRIESLHHRLQAAKDADGQPLALLDELMVFLEDPPPGVGDRWQAGAELCAAKGVAASRMSVWRLYRAHVLEWRMEQAPPGSEASEKATIKLQAKARHLVALRAVESLLDPHLPPHVLVGMGQNENRRQELLLARERFDDQIDTRARLEHRQEMEALEKRATNKAFGEACMHALFHPKVLSGGAPPTPSPDPVSSHNT